MKVSILNSGGIAGYLILTAKVLADTLLENEPFLTSMETHKYPC